MGISYAEGQMTGKVDHQKAVDCYRQAAMLGNSDAMFHLGVLYGRGLGVQKDAEASAMWFQKSADAGNTMAMEI